MLLFPNLPASLEGHHRYLGDSYSPFPGPESTGLLEPYLDGLDSSYCCCYAPARAGSVPNCRVTSSQTHLPAEKVDKPNNSEVSYIIQFYPERGLFWVIKEHNGPPLVSYSVRRLNEKLWTILIELLQVLQKSRQRRGPAVMLALLS
ncbi:hypothetical protein CB1_001866040 [Camelus ferus]|nr:hypothetical protein CB1_001866040 [Camelus ferus]